MTRTLKTFLVPDFKHQNNPYYILKVSILNSQPFKIDSRTVRVLAMAYSPYQPGITRFNPYHTCKRFHLFLVSMFSRFQNHTQLDILSKKYEIFVIYEKTNYPLWKVNVKIIHSSLHIIQYYSVFKIRESHYLMHKIKFMRFGDRPSFRSALWII